MAITMSGTEKVVGALAPTEHSLAAVALYHARVDRRPISPLRQQFPGIASADASSGCPAVVLGRPADAITALANDLARQEDGTLSAGQLIFTGRITPAVALLPGMTVAANFSHLGPVVPSVAAQSPSEVDS
jgi:hypothetical protein